MKDMKCLYNTKHVAFEDPSHSNDLILESLKDKFTLAYLEVKTHNLTGLTSFYLLFQSEMLLLHKQQQEVSRLTKAVFANFMKLEFVRAADPFRIDTADTKQYVRFTKTYIRPIENCTLLSVIADLEETHPEVQLFIP